MLLLIRESQAVAEDQKTKDQAYEEAQKGAAQSTPFPHHWVRHLSHLLSLGVPGSSVGFILDMAPTIADSGIVINPDRGYPLGNPIVPTAAKMERLSSRCRAYQIFASS